MSIFDFLFARGATPEQRDKNIFLDMIDGGGRFDDDDEFKGGPLGISALLNALGVNPYGSTNAQPSSPPPRTAPVGKPARQSAPRPASPLDLVDFITANNNLGLRPSTDAELTAAFDQPVPPSLIGRPFDGAGFGYTAPPPVPQMGTTFGNLGNPIDETALNLLAPQVGQEITAAQPVNYYNTALRNPDFLPWMEKNYPGYFESIRANNAKAAEKELVGRVFMAVPAPQGPAQTTNGMPIITQEPTPPPEDNPNRHPESEIQSFMSEYDMTRKIAIMSLDALALYETEGSEALQNAFQGN